MALNHRPIRYHLFTAGFALSILGLVVAEWTPILMSVGMIGMVANAILHPQLGRNIRETFRQPVLWMPALVCVVYFLSGLWSADTQHWLNKSTQKLPFLLLPLVFVAWRPGNRTYHGLLLGFLAVMVLASAGVLLNFALHYREVVDNYLHAKTITTPANHIRYSLLAAFAAAAGVYLFQRNPWPNFSWLRVAVLVGSIFLFLFLHVLSVRSGLLAVYLIVGYLAVRYIVLQRRWTAGIFLLAALVALPVTAYFTMPTFHNKVKYMLRDLEVYRSGHDFQDFSDGRRLASLKAGAAVGLSNPVIGVGIGDVPAAIADYYREHHPALPEHRYPLPHNQFIYWFAGFGFGGLLLCTLALLWPLLRGGAVWHVPFGSSQVVLWSSFLSEATLETQLGVAIVSLFLFLTLTGSRVDEQAGNIGA